MPNKRNNEISLTRLEPQIWADLLKKNEGLGVCPP